MKPQRSNHTENGAVAVLEEPGTIYQEAKDMVEETARREAEASATEARRQATRAVEERKFGRLD